MARPLLRITAHRSAWLAGDSCGGGRAATEASAISCQFCGLRTAGWHEPYHCNDDHNNNAPANLVNSCPLCHLCQHLNRVGIDQEAVLIWLPEMDQAALNIQVRQIHLHCLASGTSPIYGSVQRGLPSAASVAPLAAYRALYERSADASSRCDTCLPSELGAILYSLPPMDRTEQIKMLGGLRLLSRGQIFSNGSDVYPEMLQAWAEAPVIGV